MTPIEKARELAEKYFPDKNNVWARANYEKKCVECACMEMYRFLKGENAALPDVPVDERIRDSIALVLTDVDEQVLFSRGVTLKAALDWLERQGKNVQPDTPDDGQILYSLTEVNERALLDRPVTLRAVIDWLASQCKQECSVCSKISNNGERMNEKDIEELKKWLCDRGYYVGNSDVAKSLRKLADEFDD